jgi:multidrug transporter EmrE-like cation transporter
LVHQPDQSDREARSRGAMTPTAFGILLVVTCALLEGFAQIALKLSAVATARRILWLVLGIGLFVIEIVVYSGALRLLEVSIAYAINSLDFVAVTLLSWWFLGEVVTKIRWIGVTLILIGTALISVPA